MKAENNVRQQNGDSLTWSKEACTGAIAAGRKAPECLRASAGEQQAPGPARRRKPPLKRGGVGPAGFSWTALALIAIALLLEVSPANAACGKSRRISHGDAECLSASWKNRGIFRMNRYRVRNMCPGYGKVVAKVDIRGETDQTPHLTDGEERNGQTQRTIRSISCCSDLGDLCNRADVVTEEGCLRRFREVSSAAMSCTEISAAPIISGENYSCTIHARCRNRNGVGFLTSITVPFTDLGEVQNCDSYLTSGSCIPAEMRSAGPALSAADARVVEGRDSHALFAITLDRRAARPVTVSYATADRTARAGADYRPVGGALQFAAGETEKTVTVAVIDDAVDEGEERFVLLLSDPAGADIMDGEAIGTIANSDPIPKAWLSRFGRTVAEQVAGAVAGRLLGEAPPERRDAGGVTGLSEPPAAGPVEGDPEEHGARTTWADLTGSSFNGRSPPGPGNIHTEGRVTTGIFGFDTARERWLAGVALSFSGGSGSWDMTAAGRGRVNASLNGLWPYLRYDLNDRYRAWALAGYGTGRLTIDRADGTAPPVRTGLGMRLVASGLHVTLREPDEAAGTALSLDADAYLVTTASGAVPGMVSARAEASRLRVVFDAAHTYAPEGSGHTLTPGMSLGLRFDGGDTESGAGIEAGIRLRYSGRESRLAVEFRFKTLLAHRAPGFEAWTASAAVRMVPGPSGLGLSLSLVPTAGNYPKGGFPDMASPDDQSGPYPGGGRTVARRLETEVGYGIRNPAGPGTMTPYAGVSFTGKFRTWRTGTRWQFRPNATLGLEATRAELGGDNVKHGILCRATARW